MMADGGNPGYDPDAFRAGLDGYRAAGDRQAPPDAPKHSLRLASDRGAAIGMDDVPRPPLSAYEGEQRGEAGGQSDNQRKFALIRSSAMTFADPEYAIEGLVETDTLALMFGKPGSGKSFVAIGMACCVATGTPYHGRAVKGGPVIYVAGEGHNGLKRRQMAWEKHHAVSLATAPLYFSNRATALMDASASEDVLAAIDAVAEAEGVMPRLVVIDTVARNFGNGDENSTKDMNAFVAGADSIKHKYPGCCVLLIHHSGHGEGERGRGSSVLIGALDAEYKVTIEDDITTLTCTKMKEGPKPDPIAFQAMEVEIGRTIKGDAVTSLAFEEIDCPAKPAKRSPALTGQALIAMQAFGDALAHYGEVKTGDMFPANRQCVTLLRWREYCDLLSLSKGESESAARKAFFDNKAKLQAKGLICVVGDYAWRVSE